MIVLFLLEYYSPHIGGLELAFKNLCESFATNLDFGKCSQEWNQLVRTRINGG